MYFEKSYSHCVPYTEVWCIDDKGANMLHYAQLYGVIDETAEQVLIQFQSGAAKWYSIHRFSPDPPPDRPRIITTDRGYTIALPAKTKTKRGPSVQGINFFKHSIDREIEEAREFVQRRTMKTKTQTHGD